MRNDVKAGLIFVVVLIAVGVSYFVFFAGGSGPEQPKKDPNVIVLRPPTTATRPAVVVVPPTTRPTGDVVVNPTDPWGLALGQDGGTPTTRPAAMLSGGKYTVKAGDTYYGIAKNVLGSARFIAAIQAANPGVPANRLRAGMTINLPDVSHAGAVAAVVPPTGSGVAPTPTTVPSMPVAAGGKYTVKAGDNYWRIAQNVLGNAKYVPDLQKANPTVTPSSLRPGMVISLPGGTGAAPAVPALRGLGSTTPTETPTDTRNSGVSGPVGDWAEFLTTQPSRTVN